MAVASGTVTPGSATTSANTLTFSHTASTSLLVVIAGAFENNQTGISGITFDGNAMTIVASKSRVNAVSIMSCAVAYLKNPPAGAKDVVVTHTNSNNARAAIAIDVSGHDTTTPNGAAEADHASSGDPTDSITSTVANSLLLFGAFVYGGDTDPFTKGATVDTELADFASGTSTTSDIGAFAGEDAAATIQAYTLDCTPAVQDHWSTASIEIVPAASIPIFMHHYKTMASQ